MADPNPFRHSSKQPTNGHGKSYEKHAAKKMGAKLQPASGALATAKGDLKLVRKKHRFLIESKSTTDASLAMKLAWLVKISEEAHAKGMEPALLFAYVLPDGRPVPNAATEWVAIPKQLFMELTE